MPVYCIVFAARCYASAAYAIMRCVCPSIYLSLSFSLSLSLSLCVCVCLSRLYFLSKQIKISSKFFHRRVATPFLFLHTKQDGERGRIVRVCRYSIDHQAPRAITSDRRRGSTAGEWGDRPSALSHYTQSRSTANRVYDNKARHYAEDNRTQSNCTHW